MHLGFFMMLTFAVRLVVGHGLQPLPVAREFIVDIVKLAESDPSPGFLKKRHLKTQR